MERNTLILALCREAGDDTSDTDVLDGWTSNHLACCDEQIDAAADGDVPALAACRSCIGLRIIT